VTFPNKETRTVWDRLERLLHREHHAVLLGHRELLALPVGERVDRGECLAGLRWINEEGGGRIRLLAGENAAKFRAGDRLRLGNGDSGTAGAPVVYESFNIRTEHLVVRRDDRFREPGVFDPLRPLQLDPEPTSLTSLALDAIDRIRRLEGDGLSPACRGILELEADVTPDGQAAIDARRELTADPRLAFLDTFQQEAYVASLSRVPVSLVQGPPGSGKTVLLSRIVSALAGRGFRVLVTAYTHRAVNNALRKIAEADPGIRVFKVGASSGFIDLRGSGVEQVRSVRNLPPPGTDPMVIGLTVFGTRALWDRDQFDVVVIDEASQVPLAYAPIAMLAGKRFVLVGDHRQLGPIVRGRHEDPLAGRSLFEHLAERYRPVLLSTTHRMNDGINDFPSRNFYEGKLKPSRAASRARFDYRPGGEFDEVFDPAVPAVLATVNHEGFRTRSEPEARAVVDLVADALLRQGLDPVSLAVISPFRAQLRLILTLLRKKLTASGLGDLPLPVVDTVERIQGQERDLIIASLTASDPDHLSGVQAEFFFSPRRLNVTLTRARTKLVVVASRHLFRALPRNLEQLRNADLFLRLYRTLPRVDLSPTYLKPIAPSPQCGPALR